MPARRTTWDATGSYSGSPGSVGRGRFTGGGFWAGAGAGAAGLSPPPPAAGAALESAQGLEPSELWSVPELACPLVADGGRPTEPKASRIEGWSFGRLVAGSPYDVTSFVGCRERRIQRAMCI